MRFRIYLSTTILILTIASCGQNLCRKSEFRPELERHIQIIISEGELSQHFDKRTLIFLKDSCTRAELLKLLYFKNPLVRVKAYAAIIDRNEPDYFQILLNHLDDTIKVTWWYYDDAADDFMVSDLMIRKALSRLSLNQKQTLIDSILLKHSYLGTSNWMIQEIEPNEKYYSIIKEKSKMKTDRCGVQLGACYALSKFKKKEDFEFLKRVFSHFESPCEEWIFRAIEENPNEIYFPILKGYFEKTIKKKKQFSSDDLKFYCRAVAKYKNKNSLDILLALTKKETYPDSWYLSYNKEHIFKAIHKYNTSIYNSLYKELKPQMNEFVLTHLDAPEYDELRTWEVIR